MQDLPRIEPARPSDAPHIAHMSRRLIESGLRWRWTQSAVLAQIRDSDTLVAVARGGDMAIAGFAIMQYRFEKKTAHLVLLAVDPVARRLGLGRALVLWLEKVARVGGIEAVELELRADNENARHFYWELGYEEVARVRGYYDGREDAIRLRARSSRQLRPRSVREATEVQTDTSSDS